MSALVFDMRWIVDQRLDLSPLVPERLAKLARKKIEALPINTTREKLTVGDVFKVKGNDPEHLRFVGTDDRCALKRASRIVRSDGSHAILGGNE